MRNIARHVLDGRHAWIERGIVGLMAGMPAGKGSEGEEAPPPRARREAAGV